MNSQFADQVTYRMRPEIDVGQIRVAANRQGRVVGWREAKAGLIQPVGNERFEMLPAANALHVFLRGKRGMPGKNLKTVEPAILDHEEPSRAAERIQAANGARQASCNQVIHQSF